MNTNITISNHAFSAVIAPKGAELKSLISLDDGREYVWQGDPKYWEDSAPLLFPICGRLNDSRYRYDGKEYEMTIHGFLPGLMPYDVKAEQDRATFFFRENEETLAQYPFCFSLAVTFALTEQGVRCEVSIVNRDEKKMYYAVGAHPGFALPLRDGATLDDHYLAYPKAQNVHKMGIDDNGLFTGELAAHTLEDNKIPLSEEQFKIDGIFLTGVGEAVELHCAGAKRFVRVVCPENDATGVWKEYGADAKFLCLEPWCGFPSISDQKDELTTKYGMYTLATNEERVFAFDIELPCEQ